MPFICHLAIRHEHGTRELKSQNVKTYDREMASRGKMKYQANGPRRWTTNNFITTRH